jgi:hypothetical protein
MNQLPENFSPQSKLWIYQCSRAFSENETPLLNDRLTVFAKQWTAHNQQLQAFGKVIEDRFILLMVDETQNDASGCSIDKSVHFLKELEKEFQVEFFNRMLLNYKADGKIITAEISDIQHLVQEGFIKEDTLVFNPLVSTKREYENTFLQPFHNSWLQYFVNK